jgi:hypothetical protein
MACDSCKIGCPKCVIGQSGVVVCNPKPSGIGKPYNKGLYASLQSVVDDARRIKDELGGDPYNCYLVWQKRDAKQRFKEIKRIKLDPVKVRLTSEFTRIQWITGPGGSHPEGFIQLEEISPLQVTEADLRGLLDGKDPPDGVEFFYEVTQDPMCEGVEHKVWRYALRSVPFFMQERFMYVVDLADQAVPRAEESKPDRDQAFQPGRQPGFRVRF